MTTKQTILPQGNPEDRSPGRRPVKSFQVLRTHLSPYQSQNFKELEGKTLNQIPGVQYITEEAKAIGELILVTNTHTNLADLSPKVLEKTRLIVHPNSGYDNFSKDLKLWNKIPLVVGHTIRAPGVAEYILGCVFQLQEMPQHLAWDKNRLWRRKLIRGMDVWVYGLGHIGSIVTESLRVLGANVTVIEPYKMNLAFQQYPHWKKGDRSKVDVHILCCGLNKTSEHLFDQEFFSQLKNDAVIINAARGKLIEEKALREFLQHCPKAQAFLDVFEEEPFGTQWYNLPQVWKTSHIAGVSGDLDQRILDFEAQVIRDFMTNPDFTQKYHNEILQNKFVDGVLV
jgi:D-3-phosphoglycerate dehydrogenase / 2-oxoglutarate reductase